MRLFFQDDVVGCKGLWIDVFEFKKCMDGFLAKYEIEWASGNPLSPVEVRVLFRKSFGLEVKVFEKKDEVDV